MGGGNRRAPAVSQFFHARAAALARLSRLLETERHGHGADGPDGKETNMRKTTTRRNWRQATASVLAAAMVAAAAPAFAQGPGPGPGPRPGRMGAMGRMGGMGDFGFNLRQLNLTDTQREQVRAIHEQHREELRAIAERHRTAGEAMRKAVAADPVDEAAIRTASAALADVQADGAILRAKVRQEVFKVLTPEQQAQAKTLRAQREQRMQDRQKRMQDRIKQRQANPGR
jgi:protein CpxP